MFKRKCPRCKEKISKEFNFCPYCRADLSKDSDDFGMLGKNDFNMSQGENQLGLPRGFNMLFNSLMKNLDKQFRELDGNILQNPAPKNQIKMPGMKKRGLSISISTAGNKQPQIKVKSFGNQPQFKQKQSQIKKQTKEISSNKLPQKTLKGISKLPKKEPSTNIRRLTDRIIYDISMPGVQSLKEVSIVKLENSLEIKAISKTKAYIKLIPINLPLIDFNFSKGKLVLEFEAKD